MSGPPTRRRLGAARPLRPPRPFVARALTCGAVACLALVLAGALAGGVPVLAQGLPLSALARRAAVARPTPRPTPWMRRERTGVIVDEPAGSGIAEFFPGALAPAELRRLGLRPPGRIARGWPAEPPAPGIVASDRFARAFGRLCTGRDDAGHTAGLVLRAARRFAVDPFLLGALVQHQSRCDPARRDSYGAGLTRINLGMFMRGLAPGRYRYGKPAGDGTFRSAEIALDRVVFDTRALLDPETNLNFAAALLRVFGEQCPAIDRAFGSIPHRSPVSHFVWGDRVRGTLAEDQILTARRRLLRYYAPFSAMALGRYRALGLASPLDGAPRLVIGVMGDPREGGKRAHAGIDLAGSEGEPVRAVADGIVRFAGVELRKAGMVAMDAERAAKVDPRRMGVRGVFVRLEHDQGLVSLYAHLASYEVSDGQRVHIGQRLGRLGRTGIHTSDAHLHFGMFEADVAIDPLYLLGPYLVVEDHPPERNAAHAHR